METNMSELLKREFGDLTGQQQVIARLILEQPEFCSYASSIAIAAQLGIHPASLVRFAQRLAFKGFGDLQNNVRHWFLSTLKPLEALMEHERSRPVSAEPESVLQADSRNLAEFRRSVDVGIVQQIAARIVNARKTVVVASGSHAAVGLVLAHQCRFMGREVELENRGGAYLGQVLAQLRPEDHLVGISFWRSSQSVVRALHWCRERQIPSSAVTDHVFSTTARLADLALIAPTEGALFFQSLVAPLAAVHCILQAVHHLDPQFAEARIGKSQEAYDHLNLYEDQ